MLASFGGKGNEMRFIRCMCAAAADVWNRVLTSIGAFDFLTAGSAAAARVPPWLGIAPALSHDQSFD